jgi:AcrR family transcriptional regulator
MPTTQEPRPTLRERYRLQVRDEVKTIALRQLAESGPAGISVNAIAKELGVSGPALYRYFTNRNELLTELVIDAHDDLADAIRAAVAKAARGARPRFQALGRAFRGWAVAQPDRYRLLYAEPVPGYDAHVERIIAAGQASMNILVDILRDACDLPAPTLTRQLRTQLAQWATRRGIDIDAPTALHAVLVWSRLHGFVSLEIGGNFAGMRIDGASLFEVELDSMAPPA